MTYDIIATGSSGNAVLINRTILIDCGVSYKALRDCINDIKIVLLTHRHSDHFNKRTLKKIANERPTVRFGCCEWLADEVRGFSKNVDVFQPNLKYDYGCFQIQAVELVHDVPNCGYKLYLGDEKLFYATDTATLHGIEAKGFDYYFIEANYTDEEINQRIADKEANGEYCYEYRARNNHLSKAECDKFIIDNCKPSSQFIYLHEHKE